MAQLSNPHQLSSVTHMLEQSIFIYFTRSIFLPKVMGCECYWACAEHSIIYSDNKHLRSLQPLFTKLAKSRISAQFFERVFV